VRRNNLAKRNWWEEEGSCPLPLFVAKIDKNERLLLISLSEHKNPITLSILEENAVPWIH
jgi:hypothetical protein